MGASKGLSFEWPAFISNCKNCFKSPPPPVHLKNPAKVFIWLELSTQLEVLIFGFQFIEDGLIYNRLQIWKEEYKLFLKKNMKLKIVADRVLEWRTKGVSISDWSL